jgi:hypothetical protein
MTDESPTTARPDITTPEGMREAMKIIRQEEFNRFCDLQRQLINQVSDDTVRETLEAALDQLEVINAE